MGEKKEKKYNCIVKSGGNEGVIRREITQFYTWHKNNNTVI